MTVSITDLIILLALWVAVVVCVFLFGWHAGRYFRADPAEVEQAVRRHPSNGWHMAKFDAEVDSYLDKNGIPVRPGREVVDDDPTAIDIARHWTALERNAGPVTTPLSHVEMSNWEAKIARDNRAWMHKHGIPDELR